MALALLVPMFFTVSAEEVERVEISFCVGDDTLIINGNPVKVEKPYVVESAGVTLVPVRVITEAFDAKVDWVDETQTVILTYPDINIVIQIGNPIAEINGRAEQLLTPPELTESGYTMVPLRFISENFGAVVTYDEATERITVVKEKPADSEVSIEGAVENKYIGDSYFGWSMENPVDMDMQYRDFDGFETTFTDGNNKLNIEIWTNDEEFDFEADYNEAKRILNSLTLVKNEKNTDNAEMLSYRLAAKDKEVYYDYLQYVTPKYIYSIMGVLSNEDTALRDKYVELISTFKCSFEGEDIYDLTNIKDGFKKFESEDMKVSFDVPENYRMTSSEDSQNSFSFKEIDEGVSWINLEIYSKSDVESAKALAERDYNHNKALLNKDLATFCDDVTKREYTDFTAWEYTCEVDSEETDYSMRDIFFELGDYVYNMRVDVELPNDDVNAFIDRIVESLKAEPLDSNEIGIIMRNDPVATGVIKAKIGNLNFEVPNICVEIISDETSAAYTDPVSGVTASCIKTQAGNATTGDVRGSMKSTESNYVAMGAEVIRSTYDRVINGRTYSMFIIKNENGVIIEQYATLYNGYLYVITVGCSELYYSEYTKDEMKLIVNSMKFEK